MKNNQLILDLNQKSRWLRQQLFDLVIETKKGHIPSSYSAAEISLALFYGGYLRFDPKNPKWPERDRFIVSKGHAAMLLYPILADLGFYPKEELKRFTKADGILRMYADNSIPGIESITGSLGHGLGIGCGYALSAKKDGLKYNTFVVVGDGECYEGSIWEVAMFAAHYKLDNFVTIVDRNRLCIMEETEKCVRLDPLEDKWAAFGWNVISLDGHNYEQILSALDRVTKDPNGKPTAIISNSVKGKGISFMENRSDWHNKMPTPEQAAQARQELERFTLIK